VTIAAALAWIGYLVWLASGFADFACHRRTALVRTSGWRESLLHLAQIALIGMAVVLWLAFEPTRGLAVVVAALLLVHTGVGYADTRVAWSSGRDIRPFEQHVHSVLDLAPWIAFGLVFFLPPRDPAWALALRTPALPPWSWLAVLLPALLLVALPAVLEFGRAWAARGAGTRQQQAGRERGIGGAHADPADLRLEPGTQPPMHDVIVDDIGHHRGTGGA
jgi:hypothetical protein